MFLKSVTVINETTTAIINSCQETFFCSFKVFLTPKCFLSLQKVLFRSDHSGEKNYSPTNFLPKFSVDFQSSKNTEGLFKRKSTTMPDRCVAANCRNVVDLSKCVFVHNIPFFGDDNFVKI